MARTMATVTAQQLAKHAAYATCGICQFELSRIEAETEVAYSFPLKSVERSQRVPAFVGCRTAAVAGDTVMLGCKGGRSDCLVCRLGVEDCWNFSKAVDQEVGHS
jgi:hypothetical protein